MALKNFRIRIGRNMYETKKAFARKLRISRQVHQEEGMVVRYIGVMGAKALRLP